MEKQQSNAISNIIIPFDKNNVNVSPIPIKAEFKLNDGADSLIGHSMILYNSTNHPGPVNTFDDVSIIAESFNVLGCGVVYGITPPSHQDEAMCFSQPLDVCGDRFWIKRSTPLVS